MDILKLTKLQRSHLTSDDVDRGYRQRMKDVIPFRRAADRQTLQSPFSPPTAVPLP